MLRKYGENSRTLEQKDGCIKLLVKKNSQRWSFILSFILITTTIIMI